MRKIRTYAAVPTAVFMLLTASAAWSVSWAADPHLSGPDVIQYKTAVGPTEILTGTPLPGGGCAFSLEIAVPLGESAPGGAEVAYNPRTCQSEIEFESGVSRAEPGAGSGSSGGGKAGPGRPNSSGITPQYGGGATCSNPYASPGYYPREACLHTWMQDPPGIHVTDLTTEVQWTPSGGCATAGAEYASYYEQHFVPTGWYLISSSFVPSFSCTNVVSAAAAAWQNNLFCANTPTGVTITQTIRGLANGTYNWSANWTKSGVCSYLLSFQYDPSP